MVYALLLGRNRRYQSRLVRPKGFEQTTKVCDEYSFSDQDLRQAIDNGIEVGTQCCWEKAANLLTLQIEVLTPDIIADFVRACSIESVHDFFWNSLFENAQGVLLGGEVIDWPVYRKIAHLAVDAAERTGKVEEIREMFIRLGNRVPSAAWKRLPATSAGNPEGFGDCVPSFLKKRKK